MVGALPTPMPTISPPASPSHLLIPLQSLVTWLIQKIVKWKGPENNQYSARVRYAKHLRQDIFQILNFSVLGYLHVYAEIPYNSFKHMP